MSHKGNTYYYAQYMSTMLTLTSLMIILQGEAEELESGSGCVREIKQ